MIGLAEISDILYGKRELVLSAEEERRIVECYDFLKDFSSDKVIYGINTGFGPMAQYRVSEGDLEGLQYNIVRSHATGAGEPLDELYVRAAMLARFETFVQGHSGVHIDVVKQLMGFINGGIYPMIPEHGSVGASGDLVQLSHMALCLIGEGEVFYKGERCDASKALESEGLLPLKLRGRDGLSLVNGTAVMTGIGLVNLMRAQQLMRVALVESTLMNEIFESYDDFMSPVLNGMKLHEGQREVARVLMRISEGGCSMRNRQEDLYVQREDNFFGNERKVQPYYSLRCIPQILGPVWDELMNAERVLVNEFNSVDDNPVVDVESRNVYHGGNFHGDYVAYEMDKLKIGVTKMTMLAERQMNYLFHDRINGVLPPFVNMGKLGLNYGLQASQFTATSTTAESQTLSNPMYVHSIPNNNDNQDVVSMGTNAALLARRVIENGYQVMAIHGMALVQGVDCLKKRGELSRVTGRFYDEVREIVPMFVEDSPKYKEIEALVNYLRNAEFDF